MSPNYGLLAFQEAIAGGPGFGLFKLAVGKTLREAPSIPSQAMWEGHLPTKGHMWRGCVPLTNSRIMLGAALVGIADPVSMHSLNSDGELFSVQSPDLDQPISVTVLAVSNSYDLGNMEESATLERDTSARLQGDGSSFPRQAAREIHLTRVASHGSI